MLLCKPLILRSYNVLSIRSFQPTHSEMTLCCLLEMLDKQVVHRSTAKCTDDWKSLRRELLRQHHSKPRGHLRDKADDNRGPFLDKTTLRDKSCGFTAK